MAVLTSITAAKASLVGGAFEALAAVSGDSLSIIAFPDSSQAYVEEIIAGTSAAKAEVAVFSPRFGDNQFGLRLQQSVAPSLPANSGNPGLLLPRVIDVPVFSTDTLNAQVNGTATNAAVVALQLYYENIQGAGQRLASWESISQSIVRYLGIEVTVTPGAAAYGTAVALNANDDRLQADQDYALLGYTCDQPVTCFRLRGPDTRFYNIPMPGHWDERHTGDWFAQAGKWRNRPHIPVINANNKATTFVDALSTSAPGATKLSLFLAQLGSRFQG